MLILVFVMLLSAMWTASSFAALTAGKSGTSTWVYMGSGKDGKAYLSTNTGNKQPKYTVKAGGTSYVGYCINPDKGWGSGTRMTSRSYAGSKAVSSMSSARKELLSYVLLYGYNSGKSAPYGNTNDYYAATQVLVWQVIKGHAVMSDKGIWTVSDTSDKYYKLIKNHSYGIKCYNNIKNEISKHVKSASFVAESESAAKVIPMKYNYKTGRWTASVEDTSGGNYLKKTAGTKSLAMNRSGYKYIFSADEEGDYKAVLMNDRNYGTGQSAMVFDSSDSGTQSVALGATDTKMFYALFSTEKEGNGTIVKTDENKRPMSGFSFRVTCDDNGYDKTHITDDNGEINVKLFPGEYTVQEILTAEQIKDRWNQAEPVKLTVREGETSRAEVMNTLDRSASLKIIKKNSDGGPLGGFKFRVQGVLRNSKTISEDEIIKRAAPKLLDEDYLVNSWTIDNKEIVDHINEAAAAGKKGGYIVKLSAEAKLISKEEPALQTSAIADAGDDADYATAASDEDSAGSTEEKGKAESIRLNLEVTVKLRAVDDNVNEPVRKNQNGITSYDFTWNGAASIYDKTFETNDEGVISINSIAYGDYTVSEEMTESQQARYKSPESQKVTVDEKNQDSIQPFVFENKARETKVKVIKKSLDGSIADITFKITGTTAWGEKIDDIAAVTDGEGVADFGYLPAGQYKVEEVNVDLEKYDPVPAQSFKISGDEKDVISLEFENIRRTDLEISKENGTTGSELEGALLRLTDKETGEVIDEWISGKEPHVIKGLKYGRKLILQELMPPVVETDDKRGFINSEGKYVTGFAKAEQIEITAGSQEKVVMVDEPTQVVICKKDETTMKLLKDAILSIVDPETGEVIHEWVTTEEPHIVEGLIEGRKYILREDKAPTGYEKARDVQFVAGEDNEVVMVDKQSVVVSVKTGDDTPYWLPLAMGLICLAAAAGAVAAVMVRRSK